MGQSNSGFVFSPHTLSPIAALKATLGLDIYGALGLDIYGAPEGTRDRTVTVEGSSADGK